jgi:hypothetical protein
MAHAPLKMCVPTEVRDVVEDIYMGVISIAEGVHRCHPEVHGTLQSAMDLEMWVSALPLGLYNNPSSTALRRATNSLLGIEEKVKWLPDEMRLAVRDVLLCRKAVKAVAREAQIRRFQVARYWEDSHLTPLLFAQRTRPFTRTSSKRRESWMRSSVEMGLGRM